MGIGLGIFLMIIGAVLTFGITADVPGLDLNAIGYILMAAGLAVVIISVLLMMARRDRGRDEIRNDPDVV
ncbi:DUF6458 family protein [Nocardiopsis sp. RSe5-2]|uniref:DUF6458 family protein n=1 Tax=Nocardiopsis endophytica TaxID=3018445 RepID=A0ABT4U9F4_9ACTN|nr:DUF6458 family protein [Nocardiopsis endophytica]MDA2813094.1 DUF6458 family protein [Nocardiopsis endophytica]